MNKYDPVICAECNYVGKIVHLDISGDYLTCEKMNNKVIYNSKPKWCPLNKERELDDETHN